MPQQLEYAYLDQESLVLTSKQRLQVPRVSLACFLWDALERHQDKRIIADGASGQMYTGREVMQLASRVALRLHQLGLTQQDIVCGFMPDTALYALAILGVTFSSAIFSGCHAGRATRSSLPMRELLAHVSDLEPKVLMCSLDVLPFIIKLADMTPCVTAVLLVTSPGQEVRQQESKTPTGKPLVLVDWSAVLPDDLQMPVHRQEDPREAVALISASSGSTGKPKLIMSTDEALVEQALALTMAMDHEDRVELTFSGFAHGFTHYQLHMGIHAGSTIVVSDSDTPFTCLLQQMQDHQVTTFWLAPSDVNQLNQLDSYNKYDLKHWRELTLTGSYAPPSVLQTFKQMTGNRIDVRNMYGSSEVCVAIVSPAGVNKLDALGVLLPGCSLRIVDPSTGTSLAAMKSGQIHVRKQRPSRYKISGSDSLSCGVSDTHWVDMGDRGFFDDRGFVYFEARAKDMMSVGGADVSPTELEQLLLQQEGVTSAAVVGVPHEQLLEAPKAFVTLAPGVDRERVQDIMRSVNASLFFWKRLAGGIEVLDKLPTNSINKIDRKALRNWTAVHENLFLPQEHELHE